MENERKTTTNFGDVIRARLAADPQLEEQVAIVRELANLEAENYELRSQLDAARPVSVEGVPYEVADKLDRACNLLLMCSLPNDISGRNMVEEARTLRASFTPYRDFPTAPN